MRQINIHRRDLLVGAASTLALPARIGRAHAQSPEIRIAHQIGLSYLPILVMKARNLIEQEGRKQGLTLNPVFIQLANGPSVNEALISRNADFGTVSLGPLLTLWERTRSSLKVKGVAAVDASGLSLNTNQPRIKSLRDFRDDDRIAMPDAGVSYQALMLQMACEKEFGKGQAKRLDRLTVSMPHPEATNALLGGRSEITAHFATAPFLFQQLESGKIFRVLTSPEILGGPATFINLVTSEAYRTQNRSAYRVVLGALTEAQTWIASHPEDAARIYITSENSNLTDEFVVRMLRDPLIRYALTPENTQKIADFSYRAGRVRTRVESWKELYFEDIHHLAGS